MFSFFLLVRFTCFLHEWTKKEDKSALYCWIHCIAFCVLFNQLVFREALVQGKHFCSRNQRPTSGQSKANTFLTNFQVVLPYTIISIFPFPLLHRMQHRLNMKLDLQSLFGVHVHRCTHWLRPRTPPPHLGSYTRSRQDRRHLFCNPLGRLLRFLCSARISTDVCLETVIFYTFKVPRNRFPAYLSWRAGTTTLFLLHS